MRRLQFAVMALCLTVSATPLSAELILDDFDDPAAVVNPSGGGSYSPVVTEHVGGLDSTRSMSVTAILTEPDFLFASRGNGTSELTVKLNGHRTVRPPQTTTISFTTSYTYSAIDITEVGVNNALLFDFTSHLGTALPTFFRVIARGPTDDESYAAVSSDFSFSANPFTAVIPFDAFTLRGGAPATPDFTRVQEIFVNFYFISPGEGIQWSVALDRIRIGRIPEPSSLSIALAGAVVVACRRREHRRLKRCVRLESCGPSEFLSL